MAAVSAFKIFLPKFILLTSIDSKSCLSFNDQPPTGPINIATLSFFDKEIFDIFFPFLSSSQKKTFLSLFQFFKTSFRLLNFSISGTKIPLLCSTASIATFLSRQRLGVKFSENSVFNGIIFYTPNSQTFSIR